MEAAIDWLRKKGLSQAAKKSGRVAAEGLVGVASPTNKAAMVEVNAETDFVARNEAFQALRRDRGQGRARGRRGRGGDPRRRLPGHRPDGRRRAHPPGRHDRREHDAAPRAACSRSSKGVVATYVHNALRPGLGKIGVLVGDRGRRARSTRWRRSAARSACTWRRPGRRRSTSRGVDPAALERETRRADRAGARLRQAGRDHREDGRPAGSRSTTRRSCCSSRSGCMTARAG